MSQPSGAPGAKATPSAASATSAPSETKYKTYVYIDGFNLYYGCLTRSNWKWLNPLTMCQSRYPQFAIEKAYYFTARLSANREMRDTPRDQQRRLRQDIYLQALKTFPEIEVVEGYFRHDKDEKLRVDPRDDGGYRETHTLVWITEEKRSDVNLATQLLVDAHFDRFHTALVVTNDSDLASPVQAVKVDLNKRVGVLAPVLDPRVDPRPRDPRGLPPRPLSSFLGRAASFQDRITPDMLRGSQLPDPVVGPGGRPTLRKPGDWYGPL